LRSYKKCVKFFRLKLWTYQKMYVTDWNRLEKSGLSTGVLFNPPHFYQHFDQHLDKQFWITLQLNKI